MARLVKLKEDDRFGHKAGDFFLVEDADYDNEKYVGFKLKLEPLDNSFYKTQVTKTTISEMVEVGNEALSHRER